MIRWFVVGAIAWATCFALVLDFVKSPKVAAQPVSARKKLSAIVRLHDPKDGRFFCSGVVVGPRTLITANHCVSDTAPGDVAAEVRAEDGIGTNKLAYFVHGNYQADYAILKGDFSKFDSAAFDFKPAEIIAGMSSRVQSCGYPYGGKLFCVEVKSLRQNRFGFSGSGVLYPGMSGGPVFNMETGHVIAVNSAVTDNEVILAPLIEIYANLQIQAE